VSDAPGDLSVERHLELRGRDWHPWVRRFLLVAVLVLPVLALLDVFGQNESTRSATGAGAALSVEAPGAARAGDQFTATISVTPREHLDDAQIVLAGGWLDQITRNDASPQASNEASRGDRLVMGYGPLDAGQRLVVRLALQVNPTAIGHRDIGVEIDDGGRPVAALPGSMRIYP
jgi:hypothetical protein